MLFDEMEIGSIRALEKDDKIGKIMVVGVDAPSEAISELKDWFVNRESSSRL